MSDASQGQTTSREQRATSDRRRKMSDVLQAKCNEGRAMSKDRQVISYQGRVCAQRATSDERGSTIMSESRESRCESARVDATQSDSIVRFDPIRFDSTRCQRPFRFACIPLSRFSPHRFDLIRRRFDSCDSVRWDLKRCD